MGISEEETSESQQKDWISQEDAEQTINISNNTKPNKNSQGKETVVIFFHMPFYIWTQYNIKIALDT